MPTLPRTFPLAEVIVRDAWRATSSGNDAVLPSTFVRVGRADPTMPAPGHLESLVDVEESSCDVAYTFDSCLGCVEFVLLVAPLCVCIG